MSHCRELVSHISWEVSLEIVYVSRLTYTPQRLSAFRNVENVENVLLDGFRGPIPSGSGWVGVDMGLGGVIE